MTPRAFMSYSWTSPAYQATIRQWAEQLISDGIDVVLDLYDLKEGQDKYAFMERMVTDPSVTHVLVFSDEEYAKKADARKAGVGTESQIISEKVYEKVEQSKFIPIVCEFDDDENPCLPTYMKARIWIDFSTSEAVNENWERLVRLLYGKPLHEKPKLGNAPAYIRNETPSPSSPAIAKFRVLRQAVLDGKKGTAIYRKAFLDTCIEYADTLRIRERPQVDSPGEQVLEDCGKLKHIRNHLIDWVLLEAEAAPGKDFAETLLSLLERLLELKARPSEINQWSDTWFEAHSVFVYETFLYIIGALLKTNSFQLLHEVFNSHYLLPETTRRGDKHFDRFGVFYGSSGTLQNVLAPEGRRLCSPAAELIKRQADREDITFGAVMEAELLILLMAFIAPDVRWYPQTLHYESHMHASPFFLRASQHKHFTKLATITGIQDASILGEAVKKGHERLMVNQWHDFWSHEGFWSLMNMDKLDSIA